MKNKLVIAKNIFCIVTTAWSSVMLTEYILVLMPFQLKGFLFEIFDALIMLLFLGIWCLPVLFIVSTILIVYARAKNIDNIRFKPLNIATIVIPVCLAALMLLTGFDSRLQ